MNPELLVVAYWLSACISIANICAAKQHFVYHYFSQCLEVVHSAQGHNCRCEISVFCWMCHYSDVHLDVSSCAVLTLHKDVLCGSNPQ